MGALELIKQRESEFKKICIEHDIAAFYLFGSAIREDFNEETSDIDAVVEMNENDPLVRGEQLLSLWDKLERFFGRKVDLITESSLRNPIFRGIVKRSKKLIYDGTTNQVAV